MDALIEATLITMAIVAVISLASYLFDFLINKHFKLFMTFIAIGFIITLWRVVYLAIIS